MLRPDASDNSVAAILINIDADGNELPIQFVSHILSTAAKNWKIVEKEAFSIVYGVKRLAWFLYGVHFYIETDHRNLLWLQESTSPKLVRWTLCLQEFNYTLLHIFREQNQTAD